MANTLTPRKIKNEFWRRFSCSETMFTLLNMADGETHKELEEASDPLCGGVLGQMEGACGIAWGGALVAGVRARARHGKGEAARWAAVEASRAVVALQREAGVAMNCCDVTKMARWSFPRFMAKGNLKICQGQMVKLAPLLHKAIDENLNSGPVEDAAIPNCASTAFARAAAVLGVDSAYDDEVLAGFAGGLGLSGNICGALAATIFAVALDYFVRRGKPKHSMVRSNMQAMNVGTSWQDSLKDIYADFENSLGSTKCRTITGKTFGDTRDLGEFLGSGACDRVLDVLEESVKQRSARI